MRARHTRRPSAWRATTCSSSTTPSRCSTTTKWTACVPAHTCQRHALLRRCVLRCWDCSRRVVRALCGGAQAKAHFKEFKALWAELDEEVKGADPDVVEQMSEL